MSTLPPNEILHRFCQRLWVEERDTSAFCPWEDAALKSNQVRVMSPLKGGREYFNIQNVKRLLADAEERLPVVQGMSYLGVRIRIANCRHWMRQLQGEPLPEDMDAGYRSWVAYLRGVDDSETPRRESRASSVQEFLHEENRREVLGLGPITGLRYVFGSGYWLSPNHHVLRVNPTHIAAICAEPDSFGINPDQLTRLFNKHGEAWCSEGEARRIVIVALVQEGAWIRVRQYRRGWTVNVPGVAPSTIARVRGFFLAFEPPGVPNLDVVLDHLGGQVRCSVAELIHGNGAAFNSADFDHAVIVPTPVARPTELPCDGIPKIYLT